MTIMRPPQQGHGWASVFGSLSSAMASWSGWDGGGAASSAKRTPSLNGDGALGLRAGKLACPAKSYGVSTISRL